RRRSYGSGAEFLQDVDHPRGADIGRSDLRLKIADQTFRHAGISGHHVDHVAIELAADHHAGRRNPQALLEDFGRVERAAGVLAADLEPVGARYRETEQLALEE